MSSKFYSARWIVPITSPVVKDGCVEVADELIVAVHAEAPADVQVVELGDIALLPGLINAHTHLEFSNLQAPLGEPAASFDQWIAEVVKYRRAQAEDAAVRIQDVVHAGLVESANSAVVAVGEITTNGELADCYLSSNTKVISLLEVINFSRDEIENKTAEVESYLHALKCQGLSAGISPHAPYTVSWQQLTDLCRLSEQYRVPCVMHLAETKEEGELLARRKGVLRDMLDRLGMWEDVAIPEAVSYLDYVELLATSWRALIVHGNYLSSEVQQFLGTKRDQLAVCFCPRTHAWFGHDRYPLEEMLNHRVRICLGTDSRASNPDLSLISEIQYVAQQYSDLTSFQILKMVTSNAAFALGLESQLGFIGSGAFSRLLSVPIQAGESLETQLLDCLSAAELVSL